MFVHTEELIAGLAESDLFCGCAALSSRDAGFIPVRPGEIHGNIPDGVIATLNIAGTDQQPADQQKGNGEEEDAVF